jgi:hypothetical protein
MNTFVVLERARASKGALVSDVLMLHLVTAFDVRLSGLFVHYSDMRASSLLMRLGMFGKDDCECRTMRSKRLRRYSVLLYCAESIVAPMRGLACRYVSDETLQTT